MAAPTTTTNPEASNNNNNNNFINEEEVPEIFHDLADEILPETHKAMEEIADFLEKGAVDLLSKVENIPREHGLDLEKSPPQSAQEAASLPESIRLRRAIQALACICRDARKDLVEVSAKIEDTREELDETLEEFEQDLEKERGQRAKEVARMQKKIEQMREAGGGGGNKRSLQPQNNNNNENENDEDQELIQELEDELGVLRKQLQTEKQLRRQEAQDRADDAKRIRASAEATFQANTENLRNQVSTLRQQLEQRSADERSKGQNVNDMALLVAKMSSENNELKEQKEQLDEQVKVLLAEKAAQPPPTREAALMESELQRLTAQLEEQSKRHEETVSSLQKRLTETETTLEEKLQEATFSRDSAKSALTEAESSRDAIRRNVDSIRAEYQSMLESERKSHSTALELANNEVTTLKQSLEHERNALRSAETKVFELSLQEERLTMEINALKVRLLHAEHETETANRRLTTNSSSLHQHRPSSIAGGNSQTSLTDHNNQQDESSSVVTNVDYSSLDSKELARQLQGALARNEELQRALSTADKKIYNLQMLNESSRHSAKFEIDDAERRAEEARKQLEHTEKQHEMVVHSMNEQKQAYLNRCVGTQANDAEKDELRADLEEARTENENLQTQLEEAFEQQRVMRENLETKLAAESSESEKTIQSLSDQLRSTRFRFNKTQARLTQIESEHATMSTEYSTISEALQKADSQFRTAERELVDLNLENTTLRNKLKQMQREVEDLRLAMQMRERELELEYASNLKKLQSKIIAAQQKAAASSTTTSKSTPPVIVEDSSLEESHSSSTNNHAAAKNSSARPLFQQLSPNAAGELGDDESPILLSSSSHHDSIRSESAKLNEKIRQLDDILLQIQGDDLQLDRQERATRDQHMSTSQKLRKEIDDLEDRMNNGGQVNLKGLVEEKKQEMVRLDDAMEKFLTQVREKRRKLKDDTASVMAQKEKLLVGKS